MIKDTTRTTLFGLLLLAGLAAALYGSVLDAPFVFDDYVQIAGNPHIKGLDRTEALWEKSPRRFLTNFTFALNHALHGLRTRGYHAVNVAAHAAVAGMLWMLMSLLFKTPRLRSALPDENKARAAFMAALLFLVHPVQTQAVSYIVQRSALFAALFYFCALAFYLQARLGGHKSFYGLALMATVAAMFCKENTVTIPLALVMIEGFCFEREGVGRKILRLLPFLCTLVIIPLLFLKDTWPPGLEEILAATRESESISRTSYLFTQFRVLVTYLRLLLVPVAQQLEYQYPLYESLAHPSVFLSLVGLLVLLFYPLILGRSNRAVSFGIFFFFLTLLPESSLFPLPDLLFEHRLYLPMAGFALVAVTLLALLKNKKIALILFVLWMAGLSSLTFSRNLEWRDPVRLLMSNLDAAPGVTRQRVNLGHHYMIQKDYIEAERQLKIALMTDPGDAKAHNNLGLVYYGSGRLHKAAHHYLKAVKLDPLDAAPHYNLGRYYYEWGNPVRAEEELREALRVAPDFAPAYLGLSMIAMDLGNPEEAVALASKAIAIEPDDEGLRYQLGNFYLKAGLHQEAIEAFRQAVRINPGYYPAFNNMGNAYFSAGDYENAERAFRQVLVFWEASEQIHLNLANTYHELGRKADAERHFQRAMALARDHGNTAMLEGFSERGLTQEDRSDASPAQN